MSGDGLPKLRNKIKSAWPIELSTTLYTLNIKLMKFKECQKNVNKGCQILQTLPIFYRP